MIAFKLFVAMTALLTTACGNPATDALDALGKLGPGTPSAPSNSVAFEEWQAQLGWHDLETLDGKDVRAHAIQGVVFSDKTSFKNTNGAYVEGVVFPLYMSVSDGGSSTLDFGPLKGLGSSSAREIANGKVYTYEYNGPILIDNSATQVEFSMTFEVSGPMGNQTKKISYSFQAIGETQKISHSFTLR